MRDSTEDTGTDPDGRHTPIARGTLPADLVAVLVLTGIVIISISAPLIRDTPLRVGVGLLFLLFVPGYIAIAILVPERYSDDESSKATSWRSPITPLERIAYSVGVSVVLVPLLALPLGLEATPWSISLGPAIGIVSAFTIGGTLLAAIRRRAVPEAHRFQVPYRRWASRGRGVFSPGSRRDGVLNLVLVVSILLAAGSVGYAVATPAEDEAFTEVTLIGDDGNLSAEAYPTEIAANESVPLALEIENHEQRDVEYSVVAIEQDLEIGEDGDGLTITDQNELESRTTEIGNGDTETLEYDLEPTMTGEDIRLLFLVYVDDEPSELSTAAADRHVSITLSVASPDEVE